MIQPLNQNSSKNLEPVEVPHFSGAPKSSASRPVKRLSGVKINIHNGGDKFINAAKKGTVKGITVIKDAISKALEFTKAFYKSVCTDIKGIAREKGAKTISTIDNII